MPEKVSIVIPLYNETLIVQKLLDRINAIVSKLDAYQWEMVFVNDGSTDDTAAQIEVHRHLFKGALRLITFSRNFGHQRALLAGVIGATGDAVICLDADLQDPPEIIPEFLAKFHDGYDVVYGIRQNRAGGFVKRTAYSLFYRLFQRIAETAIPLDAGDFGLMSRRVVELIKSSPERDIFLRGLRGWVGFKQIGVAYDRPERQGGATKYTLGKLLNLAASAFFGYSFLPLRLATGLGFATVLLSIVSGFYSIYSKIRNPDIPAGWTSLFCMVTLIGGVQLITTGILGEYIGRIYKQTQARPHFIIAEDREL